MAGIAGGGGIARKPWHHATESNTARGYGTAWRKLRTAIMQRDMYLCQPCKALDKTTPATQVDHVKPKCQAGTDDSDNLQAICAPCHDAKTAKEAATAQGRTIRPTIGLDGWPIE